MNSPNLGFLCPVTKCGIDSGFDADNESRISLAAETVSLDCPHCGSTHRFRMSSSFGRLNERPELDKPVPGNSASGDAR